MSPKFFDNGDNKKSRSSSGTLRNAVPAFHQCHSPYDLVLRRSQGGIAESLWRRKRKYVGLRPPWAAICANMMVLVVTATPTDEDESANMAAWNGRAMTSTVRI